MPGTGGTIQAWSNGRGPGGTRAGGELPGDLSHAQLHLAVHVLPLYWQDCYTMVDEANLFRLTAQLAADWDAEAIHAKDVSALLEVCSRCEADMAVQSLTASLWVLPLPGLWAAHRPGDRACAAALRRACE